MGQKSKLIPGAALIYERADGVVYARYRDPPHNTLPRWIIGGSPEGVSKATGNLFSYGQWQEIMELAEEYPTLKSQMQKLVVMYYIIKDNR